jgi:polysaccharide biosynthesis/export protein
MENTMAQTARTRLAALMAIALLSACAAPQGAGNTGQILAGAEEPEANFSVVYVTQDTMPQIASWPVPPSSAATSGWIGKDSGTASDMVEAGDTLDVQIWSNEESSLLSLPGQKIVALPGNKVSRDGEIFLPYVGNVYVAKMSSNEARQAIQDKLMPMMPSAQVLVSVTSGRKNSVEVISGVPQTGVLQLPDRSMTVLDVLAESGGVSTAEANPQVRVARGSKLYGISFDQLVHNPGLDTAVRPGDKIFVVGDKRYFLSLGAAGREAQVPFPTDKVTALDAVSLIGGLNEASADAKGVLVLRTYPAKAVRADGKGPDRQRMIFAFDLTQADGLFTAREFDIQDQDLVLVAESPLVTSKNVLAFVGSILGLGNTTSNFILNTRKF